MSDEDEKENNKRKRIERKSIQEKGKKETTK